MIKFFLLSILLTFSICAQDLDAKLEVYVKEFNFQAIKRPAEFNPKLFNLGKKLFNDEEISGNRNISCATCHSTDFGTSDGLPLPIGQGGKGLGDKRVATNSAQIIPRNSPALFNIGSDKINFMFWDGRVRHNSRSGEFTTPEVGLNGDYPEFFEIADVLDSALAAQAIFPITSHDEMRGNPGDNEIANANTNYEVWNLVMKRVLKIKDYQSLFKAAFGEVNYNIGHFGVALAHFQKHAFVVDNTGWDRYLRGDKSALSKEEKLGALAFVEAGLCARCHNGELLGGNSFFNVVAPQVGPGKDIKHNDEGLFYTTGKDLHRYMFKAPMLRNVKYSAPYFHSGAYSTLTQVIEHYSTGMNAVDNYDFNILRPFEDKNYKENLFVETDKYMNFRKKNNAHPIMRGHVVRPSDEEKRLIELFLVKSLSAEVSPSL